MGFLHVKWLKWWTDRQDSDVSFPLVVPHQYQQIRRTNVKCVVGKLDGDTSLIVYHNSVLIDDGITIK